MTGTEVVEISRLTLLTLLKVGGPLLAAALCVGLVVSFLQALTQIQETSLTFVPKMLVTFGLLLFLLPFMGETLSGFMQFIFDRMTRLD